MSTEARGPLSAQERLAEAVAAQDWRSATVAALEHGQELMLYSAAAVAAEAVAYATLALVEQQRIANLIALASWSSSLTEDLRLLHDEAAATLIDFERTPATPTSGPDDVPVVRAEIRAALGIA